MTTTITPRSTPATAAPSVTGRLFETDDFDFAARTALGHTVAGMSDIGRVLATLRQITDGDPVSWYTAWHSAAEDHRTHALAAAAAGHPDTAAWFHLAAAEAYDQALSFIDGMPDDTVMLPTFRLHRQSWDGFVGCSGGRHLAIAVPYEGDSMPGYLLRPSADGAPRPTVVVTNGSDGSLAGLWAYVARDALARDWNVFVFDGPGQQSMLFEKDVPFRHDWEAVLTPVIDTLVGRPDVDAHALLGYGISQGGYWLPRALAFEHRLIAAVVDGGVMDVGRAWFAHLPQPLSQAYQAGNAELFNAMMTGGFKSGEAERTFAFRAKPYGITSPYELFAQVAKFQLRGVADQITTPLLVCDNESDQFFPGQPQELYDALNGEKTYLRFTSDEGAEWHCEPLARGLVGVRMNEFFGDHLPA